MTVVEQMLELLSTGSCYAERVKMLKELETKHESLWREEQAIEESLWALKLTDFAFNATWEVLVIVGKCDGHGGHECRRIYAAWLVAGKPCRIREFILRELRLSWND